MSDTRTLTLAKLTEIATTLDFAVSCLQFCVKLPADDLEVMRQLAFDLHLIMRRPDGKARIAVWEDHKNE